MPDLLAGSTIRALDTPPTVLDTQPDPYTFTNAALGTAVTGGTYVDCVVVFLAPTSGRVDIAFGGRISNTTSGTVSLAVEVREGSIIGSGNEVQAAVFELSMQVGGNADNLVTSSRTILLSGLTPGAPYNARILHARATSGTATAMRRFIRVSPTT